MPSMSDSAALISSALAFSTSRSWPYMRTDFFRRAGQHLLDSLAEVGLHVAIQAGIIMRNSLHALESLVKVSGLIHADPILGKVRSGDLLSDQTLHDVSVSVPLLGYSPYLIADAGRDALHLWQRGSGGRHPMHQEVTLFELGKQLLPKMRPSDNSSQGEDANCEIGRPRPIDDSRQRGLIAAPQPVSQR